MATAETEETLVELARYATASHMEQIARAYRGVKRQIAKDMIGRTSRTIDGLFALEGSNLN